MVKQTQSRKDNLKKARDTLEWSQPKFINMFRCNFKSETDKHIDTKFELFKKYRKLGYDVWIEPTFKNNKRADVLIVSDIEIWIDEVLVSEKIENIEYKRTVYPFPIRTVKIE